MAKNKPSIRDISLLVEGVRQADGYPHFLSSGERAAAKRLKRLGLIHFENDGYMVSDKGADVVRQMVELLG